MSEDKFIVEDGSEWVSEDRIFRNGKVVHNKVLDMAYSVDEIVEVLNNRHYQSRVYDLLQNKIWYAQGMYRRTGDDEYKVLEETLKELREELYEPQANGEKYGKILEEWFLESQKEK